MDSPTITIIVPIYNREDLLERCLHSILCQNYNDFELILVDDGSSDNSGNICDNYANKDSRIKVIHQPNSGVSLARQKGIEHSSGKWILFVDSDDFIENDALLELSLHLQDSDIILFNFYELNKNNKTERKQKICGNLIDSMYSGNVFGALFNKLIKKDIITQTQTSFKYNLSFCEDMCFLAELCIKYPKELRITHLDKPLYNYDTNTVSLTRPLTINKNQINEYCKYITIISNILSNHPLLELFILPNKVDVKIGLLHRGYNYNKYKQIYPETCTLIQKYNSYYKHDFISPQKQKLLKWAEYQLGFYIIRLIIKLKQFIKFQKTSIL